MRSSALLLAAALLTSFAPAAQPAAFDIVSVRPNVSDTRDETTSILPKRFSVTNHTLRSLILRAYRLHDSQLIDAPGWIAVERFDIDARVETAPADGAAGLTPMLQTLLADRFALRVRMETRQLPAYTLTRLRRDGSLGPQLEPTAADCAGQENLTLEEIRASVRDGWPPCGMAFTVMFTTRMPAGTSVQARVRRTAVSIDELAPALQSLVDRPVLDRTGLEGRFDVEYSYSPRPADPGVVSAFGPEAPGALAAVEEQLGLKLTSERTEVPVLVVESVQRPTAN